MDRILVKLHKNREIGNKRHFLYGNSAADVVSLNYHYRYLCALLRNAYANREAAGGPCNE